ncbi:MAG: TonB-dependent receptor [bacterium]
MRKIGLKMKMVMAVSLFFFLSPGRAKAEPEGEKAIVLPEISVTATRHEEETSRIPSYITIINERQIRDTPARTVPDLLRDLAGIHVKDYLGHGRNSSVDIRGFGETGGLNTLVLVDGRRVNEIDLSGVDWTQISLERIDRLEIIRGYGSVLYGDQAVGGVINIITKDGLTQPPIRLEGNYGSYHSHREMIEIGRSTGSVTYHLSASFLESDGYRENSFMRNKTAGLRFTDHPCERFSWDLTAGLKEDTYGMPGALKQSELESSQYERTESKYPEDWASTDEYYVQFTPTFHFSDLGSLKIPLSLKEKKPYSAWESWDWITHHHLKTLGILPQYILTKDLIGYQNTITFGFDYYRHHHDDQMGKSEIRRSTKGYYVLDSLIIIPDLLFSTLGYRYERVNYTFRTASTDKAAHDEEAVQAGLTLAYAKGCKAFLSFGKAFRLPATDEYYLYYPTPGLNQNLTLQKSRQYDLGIQHSLGQRLRLGVTLFRIETTDEIFFDPVTYTNTNYPKTKRYGSEIDFSSSATDYLTLSGSYTYLDSKLAAGPYRDKKIPGVAHHKVHLGAHVRPWTFLTIDLWGRWLDSQIGISDWNNEKGKLESYTTVDARVRFQWKKMESWIGVNNLFNEIYSEYACVDSSLQELSLYPAPERNYTLGISYQF